MKWLFFQSQSHRPVQVRREVFVAPSPHPENQVTVVSHIRLISMLTTGGFSTACNNCGVDLALTASAMTGRYV